MIEKGANLNAKAEDGRSPLLAAVKSERSDLTELLLAKGADPNQKGPSGYAPLHVAAGMHGSMEMARLLIGYKADVNARDDAGNAPLHYAAVHGAKATLKLLLEHGADRERHQWRRGNATGNADRAERGSDQPVELERLGVTRADWMGTRTGWKNPHDSVVLGAKWPTSFGGNSPTSG